MSIFSKFLGRKVAPAPIIEKKEAVNFPVMPDKFLNWALLGSGRISPSMAMDFYRTSSAVATSVDLIADEIEQIEPVIIGPDGELITEHPILDLLRKPNPAEGYRGFIGTSSRMWLLTRDVYLAAEGRAESLPVNLWAIKTQEISVTESANDHFPQIITVSSGPGSNTYTRIERKRTWRFLANSYAELYRISGFSSRNTDAYADSPLEAAASEIRQQLAGRELNLNLMRNGGRPGMSVIFKDTMSPEQHAERAEAVYRDLGGAANNGKIAVFSSQDMSIEEFGTNNKDMEYSNLDKISSTAIYLRYKIPLPLISTDASTYNNMEQATLDLYDRAVLPAYNSLAEGLTSHLMPKVGLDPKQYKIGYNPEAITALKSRRMAELKIRRELNLETINELRTMLPHREPLTEGGDKLYQAGTLLPVADDRLTADNMNDLTERAKDKLNGDR